MRTMTMTMIRLLAYSFDWSSSLFQSSAVSFILQILSAEYRAPPFGQSTSVVVVAAAPVFSGWRLPCRTATADEEGPTVDLAGATRAVDGLAAATAGRGRGRPVVVELPASRRLSSAARVGDTPTAHRMFTILPLRLATNSTDNCPVSALRSARSFFVCITDMHCTWTTYCTCYTGSITRAARISLVGH